MPCQSQGQVPQDQAIEMPGSFLPQHITNKSLTQASPFLGGILTPVSAYATSSQTPFIDCEDLLICSLELSECSFLYSKRTKILKLVQGHQRTWTSHFLVSPLIEHPLGIPRSGSFQSLWPSPTSQKGDGGGQ
jgi:hypothetical protein